MMDLAIPGYQGMMKKIESNLPAITATADNFFKTQSQFMDNMLTVSHPTPIRNIRQISAEINKSKMALEEAYFKNKKRGIEIKQKLSVKSGDALIDEMADVEVQELQSQIKNTEDYMKGAVRKISAYITQFNSILAAIGKESITEEDFEKEEERYHIGKAFEQALIAARARGGMIDEGNHIYLQQIGINGAMVQAEVTAYLISESQMMQSGEAPTHEMTLQWLNDVMTKYQGSAGKYAAHKGMMLMDKQSLIGGSDNGVS